MSIPPIYSHIRPGSIPARYFGWRASVERGSPRDSEGRVLRDKQGNPVERWVEVYSSLPVAVFPPDPRDEEVYSQRGESCDLVLCFRRLTTHGALPDVRHQDRLAFPPGSSRYLEVLTAQDVGEASLLLLVRCRERRAGRE